MCVRSCGIEDVHTLDHRQVEEEEEAVKLIMADVLRLMHRAGESGRAARLRAGRIPEGPDFNHFAAHVGGAVRVVPLGCAAVRGPTTFGMLEQEGAMHVELEQTHMQGETSEAWPFLKPSPNGCHKRISLYISTDRPRVRNGKDSAASVTFLTQLQEWMQAGGC